MFTIKKRIKKIIRNLSSTKLSVSDLITQFPSIGIYPGDLIMIHSSMSSIGNLENGAATFIEAVKKYITLDGMVIMPSFPHNNMFSYLTDYEVFDVSKSPSMNGAITEYFRKDTETHRSLHPTHPIVAWGKEAEVFVSGHEKSKSPFDKNSPYFKIIQSNVKILLIGVDFEHMTICRAIEDIDEKFPINPYLEKEFIVDVLDTRNRKIQIQTKCHNPKLSKIRKNMILFPFLKSKIKFGNLGLSSTMVVRASDVFEVQKSLSKRNIYTYDFDKWQEI